MSNNFEAQIKEKSDKELIEIFKNAVDYQPDYIELIEKQLLERKIDKEAMQLIEKKEVKKTAEKEKVYNEEFGNNFANQENINEEFPPLVRRYKSGVIDGLFIILLFILTGLISENIDGANGNILGLSVFFMLFLYEPLLVSYGGTIGHRAMGLTVKSYKNRNKNINFPFAFLRSLTRWLLGAISIITIFNSKEKLAIHDYISNSIILNKNNSK